METKLKIENDLFTPLSEEEKKIKAVVRPSIGYWKDAWMRLKRDKFAIISLVVISAIIVAAIFVQCYRSMIMQQMIYQQLI